MFTTMTSTEDIPSIKEFFTGKHVFITGGSGFMGKVLIEKILRSCPGVDTIYVLMRPKKNKSAEERLKQMCDVPLFDLLKEQQPNAIEKIKPILGDVSEVNLGISEEDRQLLIKNVNIVYHAAASIRFDDPLSEAILTNTRGTREVVLLAQKMENLEVLLHVSTAYCHTDKKVVEEKIYPPTADWREAIKLAETLDSYTLDIFCAKYIDKQPNTYTFTKLLSEYVVTDLCTESRIPFVIIRPSIVISCWRDPLPGWIDIFNGPVGLFIAVGKGVLRCVYTDPNIDPDFLPVDVIIKGIIIASWLKAVETDPVEKYKPSVYNGCNNSFELVTNKDILDMGTKLGWQYPLHNMLWFPEIKITKCRYNHYLNMIFYQLIPALLIDGLLKISGRKPMLVKVQKKIYTANIALEYFIINKWEFKNFIAMTLEDKLKESEKKDFSYNKGNIDVYDYFRNCIIGGKRYLLKEDDSTLEEDKIMMKRMWIISRIFNIAWYATIAYILFYKVDIIAVILGIINNMYLYFTTD